MTVSGYNAPPLPSAFVWRRLHSFMGIWLSIYLVFHLFTNSQAALLIGDDGKGFIEGVNTLSKFPYLPIVEIVILGIPFFIHIVWGIKYALTARYNSFGDDKKHPYLPEYPRNKAYTWQRITSYLLVLAVVAHVVHMRFMERPLDSQKGSQNYYFVRVNLDQGLYTLAPRLGVELYDKNQVQLQKEALLSPTGNIENSEATLHSFVSSLRDMLQKPEKGAPAKPQELVQEQKRFEDREWVNTLEKKPLSEDQAIAVAKNFGTAELLMLRETFKQPLMIGLYTFFVLIACFHGFNGLWTFLISWGITLSQRTQTMFLRLSYVIMAVVSFLGLSTIWMTYWINLKQ